MKGLLFLSIILLGRAYELLTNYMPSTTNITFHKCCDIETSILNTTKDVFKDFNQYRIFNLSLEDGNYGVELDGVNTVCSFDDTRRAFGYATLQANNEADISISRELIDTPITLYNVIYHEVLHACGLNHTTNKGLMSYKIYMSKDGNILEDRRKMYPSYDDMIGLMAVKNKINI